VGPVPKRGCLLTLAYYAFPRWYEFGERRWNDILTRKKWRTRRKTCPSATLPTTNPTWIDQGANPGLRGERPATNDLSHDTTLYHTVTGTRFFSSPMICELFFRYDGYTIVVKAASLRIVQCVWSEMHKNSLTIDVICEYYHTSNRLIKFAATLTYNRGTLEAAATSLGTTGLEF
jgi:hypothetical protein